MEDSEISRIFGNLPKVSNLTYRKIKDKDKDKDKEKAFYEFLEESIPEELKDIQGFVEAWQNKVHSFICI